MEERTDPPFRYIRNPDVRPGTHLGEVPRVPVVLASVPAVPAILD
jgi:hypothetical protein